MADGTPIAPPIIGNRRNVFVKSASVPAVPTTAATMLSPCVIEPTPDDFEVGPAEYWDKPPKALLHVVAPR
jgi:hypothetical protein